MESDSPRPTDACATAERFANAYVHQGYRFDFSLDSLRSEVDRFLESEAVKTGEGPAAWYQDAALEAYVGETLARLFDGQWTGAFRDDNPGSNFYLSSVAFGGFSFWPSHFIAYHRNNGASEGTFADHLGGQLPSIRSRASKTCDR